MPDPYNALNSVEIASCLKESAYPQYEKVFKRILKRAPLRVIRDTPSIHVAKIIDSAIMELCVIVPGEMERIQNGKSAVPDTDPAFTYCDARR